MTSEFDPRLPFAPAATSSAAPAAASAALALATMLAEEAAAAPSEGVINPFLPRKPHFEPKAKSRHLPVHGRRAEPRRSVRPEAGTDADARQAAAGAASARCITPMGTGGNNLLASKRKFAKHGKSRPRLLRLAAAHGEVRRRLRRPAGLPRRRAQPRRLRLPDEHRLHPRRPAEPRVVGALRPRHA